MVAGKCERAAERSSAIQQTRRSALRQSVSELINQEPRTRSTVFLKGEITGTIGPLLTSGATSVARVRYCRQWRPLQQDRHFHRDLRPAGRGLTGANSLKADGHQQDRVLRYNFEGARWRRNSSMSPLVISRSNLLFGFRISRTRVKSFVSRKSALKPNTE